MFPILLSHTTVQILMCGTRGSWDAGNLALGISTDGFNLLRWNGLSDGKESAMLKTPVGKSLDGQRHSRDDEISRATRGARPGKKKYHQVVVPQSIRVPHALSFTQEINCKYSV